VTRTTGNGNRRERILRALAEVVAREGYAAASIAQAISLARVSRSTFYEHFEDKLDCFLTLERDLGERMFAEIKTAARECEPIDVTRAALSRLVSLAEQDPAGMRVLLTESLAAGPRAMDARETFVTGIEELLEDAWARMPAASSSLDVPAVVLVGGTCRLLSLRILRGVSGTHGLLPDLLAWAESYARAAGEPRWRTVERERRSPRPLDPDSAPAAKAAPLPPGRHDLSSTYVAANQRQRILQATTTTVARKGYLATTVADIVSEARVTRAVFYQHFRDKQEVLSELNQVSFQETMSVSARAFFSAATWPERLWEGILAAAAQNNDNGPMMRLSLIETSTIGRELATRLYDLMMAFAIFFEEGYRYRREAEALPRLCSEAISSALFELLYREVRRTNGQQFSDLVPYVSYIALAPFMGADDAGAFVEAKLSEPLASAPG
jgi:AcrR family transcriptional regulator